MSPIPGLPFEIVLEIIDNIYHIPTLNAVSRTCWDLHNASIALLYNRALTMDDEEVQSTTNIHTNYDVEEFIRDYGVEPYTSPIVLWAAAVDAAYGLPVLQRVLALRPMHLWATFHIPGNTCESHWPWISVVEGNVSHGRTTALHVAAASGNFACVDWLLEDYRTRGILGIEVTATYACICPSRHLQVLQQRHGLREAEDCPDATPLHLALAHGHIDVAKLLILQGANWSTFIEGCHGVTGLMIMVANGQLSILEWLIDNNLLRDQDVKFEDNLGLTAPDYLVACMDENTTALITHLLSDRKITTIPKRDSTFHLACEYQSHWELVGERSTNQELATIDNFPG
ncbi:ankyrin unc44 [Colletotrichum truncatum]|uniref:Ankyrin unc44 n=1 Tax=Colletotrichum truncatum TaxID=5467 RepID=A0ACC3YT75_COLTU|nr:ankyrin unc44 [Colletotrichum truncatum]KAF6799379.1 ankyrin unc44 [Colletotrichum truncatum]